MEPPSAVTPSLQTIPREVLLYLFSFLDLPDLVELSRLSQTFAEVASDRALHRRRLLVITPSRIDHSLFAQYRPTIPDLVNRGWMRGLQIERRWRDGHYFASQQSVSQYNMSVRLERNHIRNVLANHLRRRPSEVRLYQNGILPDVEMISRVSRVLIPALHNLKWCLQRDGLARKVRRGGRPQGMIEDESMEMEAD